MDITLKPFRATGHPKPVASFKVTEKSWKIFTYHSQLSDFYELAKNLEKKEKIQVISRDACFPRPLNFFHQVQVHINVL